MKRDRARTFRLGDRGAVAVEFALVVFPLMMLMFFGIFGLGYVMAQMMQLNFVTDQAAILAANGGDAPTYATTWAPYATVVVTNGSHCAGPPPTTASLVSTTLPVSLGIAGIASFNLTASACAVKPGP